MAISLFFGEILVGYIDRVESDFPSFNGYFVYDDSFIESSNDTQNKLKKFLYLQARYCEIYDTEDDVDESEVDQLNAKLEKCSAYNDSVDWFIVGSGNKEGIMCPIIYNTGEISWR
ncbi:hypothetical protein [Zooshikella harenae]|uniref:Uncharacterized protein n=1 Tax=Zooshikella harenae TaxID=2827238 RepID=A0ABS5ZAE2_9GAMM|nr:hypothetical protein [Zooshikella harenae]MBU2710250.1 hypothetical protein [Zooshikella harenae]